MEPSAFNTLLNEYLHKQTSVQETAKIEMMLSTIRDIRVQSLSDEAEDLLYQRIKDPLFNPWDATCLVKIVRSSGALR